MKRLLYWLLKKDMIKRLKQKHGEQFVDDVMETFGMPTNFISKDLKQINIDLAAEEVADSVFYHSMDLSQKNRLKKALQNFANSLLSNNKV